MRYGASQDLLRGGKRLFVTRSLNKTGLRTSGSVEKRSCTYICAQLQRKIVKHNTRFRQAISVQKRVAITLWVLATPCEYRRVAHLFGLARCTVCCIVHDTCKAIVKLLLPKYIRFPTGDRLNEVVQGILSNGGFYNVQDQLMGHTYQSDHHL